MEFPESATKEEREIDWPKIAEFSDSDLGFNDIIEEKDGVRFNTRLLLEDYDGKICIIKSEKYGYMQIPGGGIDEGETIVEGLRREAKEETGYVIDDIKPLGYVIEHRESVLNKYPWSRAISFVFKASPAENIGTKYLEHEIAEGFVPKWVEVNEMVEEFKRKSSIKAYTGAFANRRDLEILKYYQSLKS